MIKVSVIIPMYNREKLICECIKSVQKQNLKDIEIICVDDGSTDSTIDMVMELQKEDSRIRLIKIPHGGAGKARNKGIENAEGKYLVFLDSDDIYYEEDSLLTLYNACTHYGVKACCARKLKMDYEGNITRIRGQANDVDIFLEDQNVECFFKEKQDCWGFTAFIFESEWIKNRGIRFPNISRFEDPVFLAQALFDCGRYYYVPKDFYLVRNYWQDINHLSKNVLESLVGWKAGIEFAIGNNLDIMLKKIVDSINCEENIIVNNISSELLMGLCEINQIIYRYSDGSTELAIINKICDLVSKEYLNNYSTAMPIGLRRQLEEVDRPIYRIREWFFNHGISKCLIYGVGGRGNALINLLLQAEIDIEGTIDAQGNHYKNLNIYEIENMPRVDAIIVTPRNYKDIVEVLKSKGYKNYFTLDKIIADMKIKCIEQKLIDVR